jgi:hypothetical protein
VFIRTGVVVVAFDSYLIIFAVIFVLGFLMIAGTSGFMVFNIFRIFNRVLKDADSSTRDTDTAPSERRRRALEIVSQQPPGTPAQKCRNCGATVDSTAELSADGKVRCNYCNQWSSIYQ